MEKSVWWKCWWWSAGAMCQPSTPLVKKKVLTNELLPFYHRHHFFAPLFFSSMALEKQVSWLRLNIPRYCIKASLKNFWCCLTPLPWDINKLQKGILKQKLNNTKLYFGYGCLNMGNVQYWKLWVWVSFFVSFSSSLFCAPIWHIQFSWYQVQNTSVTLESWYSPPSLSLFFGW